MVLYRMSAHTSICVCGRGVGNMQERACVRRACHGVRTCIQDYGRAWVMQGVCMRKRVQQ